MSIELILGYSITILSLFVAIITTYVSFRSLRIAEESTKATIETVELFNQELEDNTVAKNMEFHYSIIESFRNLQLQFPPGISDKDYQPTEEDKRLIFVFWFLIFDEWFACKHEGKYLKGFWDKYYIHELRSVMYRTMFTDVLKSMVEEKKIGFFGLSDSFSEMLNIVYKEIHGKNLFDRFN